MTLCLGMDKEIVNNTTKSANSKNNQKAVGDGELVWQLKILAAQTFMVCI